MIIIIDSDLIAALVLPHFQIYNNNIVRDSKGTLQPKWLLVYFPWHVCFEIDTVVIDPEIRLPSIQAIGLLSKVLYAQVNTLSISYNIINQLEPGKQLIATQNYSHLCSGMQ